jgi:hypothetical protein
VSSARVKHLGAITLPYGTECKGDTGDVKLSDLLKDERDTLFCATEVKGLKFKCFVSYSLDGSLLVSVNSVTPCSAKSEVYSAIAQALARACCEVEIVP